LKSLYTLVLAGFEQQFNPAICHSVIRFE